ncbi:MULTISPECIES: acetylxylan esterase [Kitasatospora]|uniref:Putative acetyl xylan esterase n=1 Tax=Kitasatospora setae (strain ATCC 33774 / DSM 43861 / JCM 3304 / KCC A-0304 / NBRC 14216 / KM-6054) TaxID=452652 RepID=E4N533_KITSK|nr:MULTISPECIES: acetylxylan esterase [Kitasatospora]BAJ26314.1 putative acetyl xylan esterase [Kitasatospora setae KM-6054]
MAFLSMNLSELREHRPARTEPDDFAAFWAGTLAEARAVPARLDTVAVETGLATVTVEDVTFPGYAGQPIKGWLVRPRGAGGPLPAVVSYVGYGGGRGLAHEHLLWASAGYAHLVMDTRGQGGGWAVGDTSDEAPSAGPAHPGSMTRGVLDPAAYYYRRLYTDAVRAVDAVRTHPGIDPERVLVAGSSQGGGLALAVAGLVPDLAGVVAEVPFLQHIRRATEITDAFPYKEVADFCKVHRDKVETVFATLAYVDGLHFAARATAPALYSVALMDEVCPPETVFASYHHYRGPKEIAVYPYNGHEGGGAHHVPAMLAFAAKVL